MTELVRRKHQINLFGAERLLAKLIKGNWDIQRAEAFVSELMRHFNNDRHLLATAEMPQLMGVPGMTKRKAETIMDLFAWKAQEYNVPQRKQVTCSRDTYEYLRPVFANLDYEIIMMVVLNKSNRILRTVEISVGGLDTALCCTKTVMRQLVMNRASCWVMAHNHPSGRLRPSQADLKLCGTLAAASKTLDILLLDCLILSDQGYYSFADEGLMTSS